jgi:hypothetical protein
MSRTPQSPQTGCNQRLHRRYAFENLTENPFLSTVSFDQNSMLYYLIAFKLVNLAWFFVCRLVNERTED